MTSLPAAAEALRAVSGYQLDEADVADVLPAHPDAEPAMRKGEPG